MQASSELLAPSVRMDSHRTHRPWSSNVFAPLEAPINLDAERINPKAGFILRIGRLHLDWEHPGHRVLLLERAFLGANGFGPPNLIAVALGNRIDRNDVDADRLLPDLGQTLIL